MTKHLLQYLDNMLQKMNTTLIDVSEFHRRKKKRRLHHVDNPPDIRTQNHPTHVVPDQLSGKEHDFILNLNVMVNVSALDGLECMGKHTVYKFKLKKSVAKHVKRTGGRPHLVSFSITCEDPLEALYFIHKYAIKDSYTESVPITWTAFSVHQESTRTDIRLIRGKTVVLSD